jgi:hypothetical protein
MCFGYFNKRFADQEYEISKQKMHDQEDLAIAEKNFARLQFILFII